VLGFDALGKLALGQLPGVAAGATVFEGSWHQPFIDRIRQRTPYAAARQQFESYVEASPFPGQFTPADVPLWPQLSQPSLRRKPLPIGDHQFASFVEFAPFAERVTADRWFVPFSEPVRFRPKLITANQKFPFFFELPVGGLPVFEAVSLIGVATITAIPTSNYKQILTETTRRIIYAAEISPWTVAR
jgi:hypothetical protein